MKNKFVLFLCLLIFGVGNAQESYLLEAESFEEHGGWCLDHQAFPKIGSAYMMAHGMGIPVADAKTKLCLKHPGQYHLYVCTYNWTSPWWDGKGPGAFKVQVNEEEVTDTLGTQGNSWNWQYAGMVNLKEHNEIRLHDLTGFNGRVDALYFTPRKERMPINYEEMLAFRKKCSGDKRDTKVREVDLVVVGAGVAGCATALTAARLGLRVILVDNLPKLGGNNYLGVKMSGLMGRNKYSKLGNVVRELSGISNCDYHQNPAAEIVRENGNGYPVMSDNRDSIAALREKLLIESGVKIYHGVHVYKVRKKGRLITAVTGKNLLRNLDYEFKGKLFVDGTGDGEVGYLSGAHYMMGREPRSFANEPSAPGKPDSKMLGATLSWNAVADTLNTVFPDISQLPWAMQCSKEYYVDMPSSNWTWETGFEIDNAKEAELVRDNMLRAIYGNWSYLKNHLPKYRKYKLEKVSYVAQKRESRRLVGDLILTENDIRNHVEYPDASFTTTWTLDLHFPQARNSKFFKNWEWRSGCPNKNKNSWITPYHVPYRVLYSRDIDNLFIGGRCMSVTHIALGSVRVQATLGMAGEVIGMAAKICNDYGITPREVYQKHLDELKSYMIRGAE